jgi:hypothetical protein
MEEMLAAGDQAAQRSRSSLLVTSVVSIPSPGRRLANSAV